MSRFARKLICQVTLSKPATRLYDRIYGYYAPTDSLGTLGERAAERFLLKQGLIIVARGYQDRFGEIDLIAIDGQTIVFVEVKTRSSDFSGQPAEAVDETKQQHLAKTALSYLKWNRLTDCCFRFDVVAITWPEIDKAPKIRHYVDAFEPAAMFQLF